MKLGLWNSEWNWSWMYIKYSSTSSKQSTLWFKTAVGEGELSGLPGPSPAWEYSDGVGLIEESDREQAIFLAVQ